MFSKRTAIRFIVLLGIVSLFADIVYEGARSIVGPYLSLLGASGAVVGLTMGIGELIGYGIRAISGLVSDKTQRYWTLTFIGYIINLVAVPLLAFADNWQMATTLIILERFGKGLRVPARDAMLSFATKKVGRGWGFGIHESLDQIGAVLGPLALTLVLFLKGSYQTGFAFLSIPMVMALTVLTVARKAYPYPQKMEKQTLSLQTEGLTKKYWVYVFAMGFVALGYADFALIAYHFQKAVVVSPAWIPFFYAIAMGVDGITALIMGKFFDMKGLPILVFVTALSSLFAPLVFLGGFYAALTGMILWGIGMGSQESIMRASVANLTSPNQRGTAYGILNLVFGVFWAVGSGVIGFLYDVSLIYVVLFSLLAQLTSIPLFLSLKNKLV